MMTETANVDAMERDERNRPTRTFAEAAASYGADVRKMLDTDHTADILCDTFSGETIRLYARCAFRCAARSLGDVNGVR